MKHICKSCTLSKIETAPSGITPINGEIKWHLDENYLTPDLNKFQIIFAMDRAFAEWQTHIPAQLASTGNVDEAAVVIKFMRDGNPDLPSPFGIETLAYAFFPDGESLGVHSDIYVNDLHDWAEMHTDEGFNLFKVIVHEIGHSLGLGHSEVLSDIMYPTYQPDDSVVITQDTLDGIAKLYGVVDVPVSSSALEIFRKILTRGKKSLSRMYEDDIVAIANCLGIDASARDKKTETVTRIYEKIGL